MKKPSLIHVLELVKRLSSSLIIEIWLVIVFSGPLSLCCGQQIQFKHYQSEDGFVSPAGHRTFAQDSLGFLWIGTGGGLHRFDGYSFKLYRRNPKDSLTLFKETADMLKVDPAGKLWVVYEELLQCYDAKLDGFLTYRPLPEGFFIRSLFFDSNESMWIGTRGGGLFFYNFKTGVVKNYRNHHNEATDHFDGNYVYDITFQKPFVLLATADGLWRFHPKTETFSRPRWNERDSVFFNNPKGHWITRIIKMRDHFWVTSTHGMIKLDTSFAVLSKGGIGSQGAVVDAQGKVWIPTQGNGLMCYDSKTASTTFYKHDPGDPTSLPSDLLWSAFLDKDQNIWLGVWNGGICKIKRPSLSIHNYLRGYSLNHPIFLEGKNKRMVLITSLGGGLLSSPLNASLTDVDFTSMTPGLPIGSEYLMSINKGSENLWIGSFGQGAMGIPIDRVWGTPDFRGHMTMITNTGTHDISVGSVGPIYEDKQRNLWLGVMSGGLNRVYLDRKFGEPGSVKIYWHEEHDSTSMAATGWISGIYPENDTLLWVSSYGGLELFHYRTETFEHIVRNVEGTWLGKSKEGTVLFGTKQGLLEGVKSNGQYRFKKVALPGDPFISSVLEDAIGRLWIGTLQGLYCFDRRDSSVLQFNSDDGLVKPISRSTMTPEGLMVLAGGDGVSVVDPMSLTRRSSKIRPVITQLRVDGRIARTVHQKGLEDDFIIMESVIEIRNLELDHSHKSFSIEFASMDLTAPTKILYRHQLEGFDPDWVQTDSYHRIQTYQNLSPGTYHFKVKATNADGVWSDYETTLDIAILPAPWKTWWAYTGYSLLAVGLLLLARRNIVQRERLKSNLKLAKVEQEKEHFELEKAKEVDRVKTSFFTNISHEFRTPLTLIKGPVHEMLEQFKDDPKAHQRLKLVQRNSDLLLRLINQLLDLARLESGALKVEKSEGEVFSFIRAVGSSFESFARQKGIALRVDVPASTLSVMFDKDKVETILINLINNAIKFTPQGGEVAVKVTCGKLTAETQRHEELCLRVSDTGIGIPADHQSKIFERFHQVSESHNEVGTGIGLSLVKELVALMGGTITVESEPGKGSSFIVTLPLESVSAEQLDGKPMTLGSPTQHLVPSTEHPSEGISNIEYPISNDEVDPSRPQVLVVEDNADLRAFIIDSLGTEFQFHQAENGKQGLQIATEQIPVMIISDVMMPEMDGMEMTRRIKEDIRTSHIPLILLTAKSGEDSKLEGLSKGADDYLTKPFNKQELLLKVRNGTQRMQKLRDKLKVEVLSTAPHVEVLSADEQFLNKVKETIIERMSDEQLSVESLADDIGMSRVQLYRKVSALTGMAVNELIRKLRLQRAAQLLQQNWGSVSQVAYEVGFSNLSYFSKVFKEEFGANPSEYDQT